MTVKTYAALRSYLGRLGFAEWEQQKRPMGNKRRHGRSFFPSEYHRALIACLDKDDENGFKALKMEQGPFSALGF
jgi:hypothetical protein